MQENAYSRIASELNVNKNLSVMIVNASSLLAHTANNQQIMDGFNLNKIVTHLIMRDCVLTNEASILMSSYIKISKLYLVCFARCKFSKSADKIFASLSEIKSLEMVFFDDIDITEDSAILVANMIVSNSKINILDLTNCSLGHNAALNITGALKNISTLQTLTFDNCNL